MTNKATKYGLMTIAAVLLVAMAFAGAGAAMGGNPVLLTDYSSKFLVMDNETGIVSSVPASTFANGETVYLLEDAADWNAVSNFTNETLYNGAVLILRNNLDFSETDSDSMMNYSFNGSIYGNGKVIKNFANLSAIANMALIRYAGDGLYLNYIQLMNCTVAGGGSNIAILIAEIPADTEVTVIGCSVTDGKISNNAGRNGGLIAYVGGTNTKLILNYSKVLNTSVSTSDYHPGGLIGRADKGAIVNVSNCNVTDSRVHAGGRNSGGLIGTCAGDQTAVNLLNCVVSNCSIFAGGQNVGGLVAFSNGNPIIHISDCKVLNCNITTTSYGVGGIFGHTQNNAPIVTITDSLVSHCIISGPSGVGGVFGMMQSDSLVNISGCTVTDSFIEATEGGYIGGVLGRIYFPTKIEKIANCTVNNCIIDTVASYVGGLAGYAGALNNVTDSRVSNCTISGSSSIGGFIGYLSPRSDWDNNTVSDCAVKGTSSVALDIGNLPGEGECSVLSGYINQTSLTSLQPLILISKNIDDSNHLPSAAITVTRLSDIGVKCNMNALGYVIDSSPLVFNLGVSGKVAYFGTVKIGANNISPGFSYGYIFNGWNISTPSGTNLTNATGDLLFDVPGYTNATGYWNNLSGEIVDVYANWTVYSKENTTNSGVAAFNDNANVVKIVAIQNPSTDVNAVNITYEPTTAAPSSDSSYTRTALTPVFNITLTGNLGSDNATIVFNFSTADLNSATPNCIYLAHKKNGAWEYLKPTYVQTGDVYTFTVTGVTSFSPFVPISMTAVPQQYTPSSSKQTGSTVILQEGQTAPTAYATTAPTVTPTAKPTEQPATPTVIATAKPTTQATQQSPAPFFGILAGLGVAALVYRLRK